jgi:type III secretion protein U
MSEEKTEDPTEKRLRDAREDGEVAKSTDLTDAVTMAAALATLMLAAGAFAGAIRAIVATALDFVPGDHSLPDLFAKTFSFGTRALIVIVPCVGAAAAASIAALIPQIGFQISMKPVVPDLANASPVSGIKQIFSSRTLIELAKMLVKAVVIACTMWVTIRWMLPLVVGSLYQPLPQLSKMFWDMLIKLCAVAAVAFGVIGAIDIKIQQVLFMRKQRMSKDEVKREYKEQEGDPLIKGERKKLARQWATEDPPRLRVGFANALIVNPTHYAVAIRYAPNEHPLPLVTAKGMDESAAQLRHFAQEASVPIIGNPPVARALYKVGIDEPIPEELFETVAAILRWVESIGAQERMRAAKNASPHGLNRASH